MSETQADLMLVDLDDIDDIDAHAVFCVCDECRPDFRHDRLEAA